MEAEIYDNLPKSKEEALNLGSKSYFTGVPCKNGHIEKRYTNTGICYECKRLQANRDYLNHTDRAKEIGKRTYEKAKQDESRWGRMGLASRKWSEQNKEKRKEIVKRNKEKHKAEYAVYNSNYNKEKIKCPFMRKHKNMQKYVWAYLKGILFNSKHDGRLGYSFEELRLHLEKQFTPEMNWDNYGTYWEIDHKIPTSWYNTADFATIDSFLKEVWKLTNVHPITVSENAAKCNRYAHFA